MTITIKNTVNIIAPLGSECQVIKFKKMKKNILNMVELICKVETIHGKFKCIRDLCICKVG